MVEKPDTNDAYKIIWQLRNSDSNKLENDTYVLLKADTSNLDIDFFFDPNAENCVYTKENVQPKLITVEEEYKKI